MEPKDLLDRVDALRGRPCTVCDAAICGHEAVTCIAMGFGNAPRCLRCLATTLDSSVEELRDSVFAHVQRRDCYAAGWRQADEEEASRSSCQWGTAASAAVGVEAAARPAHAAVEADRPAFWDAGDMGCGDLVMELRLTLLAMAPGALLDVRATDPGAIEDIPAWCGMTGHELVGVDPPVYRIRRKS